MAKNDYELDLERGQPVELYLFLVGKEVDGTTDQYLAYTTAEKHITHNDPARGDITYQPLAGLTRTNIKSSGKPDKSEITVTVPRTSDIGNMFNPYPPPQKVSLIIREGHIANIDDPGSYATGELFPVSWIGRVLEATREGPKAELNCESGTASMKRMGLRRHYQWNCPWRVYSTRCGASKAAATHAVTVGSFTGASVTPNAGVGWISASGFAAGFYAGGEAAWQGSNGRVLRRILRVDASTGEVFLAGPTTDMVADMDLDLVLGCSGTVSVCENIHNNIQNYGGCPGIPRFNPAGKNNHT